MEMMQIDYRPTESFWVRTNGDRVQVIFSIKFSDPDDAVFGRVYLSEFGKNLSGAPAVDVKHREPPRELANMRNANADGYVTFMLENRHYSPRQLDKTLNMLVQFRDYLHYHLKCSKAYLHIRMRTRVDLLLQVLNRAKQELPKEKKTASGRTFTRK
jgi:actin related protein 2/3 complex subunit 2